MQAATQRVLQPPTPEQLADLRLAASKMTGATRRAFQAEMTWKYCGGNARQPKVCLDGDAIPSSLASPRGEPVSYVSAPSPPAVAANAGKPSIHKRHKPFVNWPKPMLNKTRRFAPRWPLRA